MADAGSPRSVLQAELAERDQPAGDCPGFHRCHLLPGLEGRPTGKRKKVEPYATNVLENWKFHFKLKKWYSKGRYFLGGKGFYPKNDEYD